MGKIIWFYWTRPSEYQVIQTFDGGYFATGFLDVGLSEGEGNDLYD